MKIKTKLYAGLFFLFSEFVIVGLLCGYSIFTLSDQVKKMTKDNIASVAYTESMTQAIDQIGSAVLGSAAAPGANIDSAAIDRQIGAFELALRSEEGNITEPGEKELASSLRQAFDRLKIVLRESPTYRVADYLAVLQPLFSTLKTKLYAISDLNMAAITSKNSQVSNDVDRLYIGLSMLATVFFIVSFTFVINFPNYILGPLKTFTRGLGDLAASNFGRRIDYRAKDEFAEMAKAFNAIAERLDQSIVEPPPAKTPGRKLPSDRKGSTK